MSAFELLESRFGTPGAFNRRFLVTAPDPLPVNWDPRDDTELKQKAGKGTEFPAIPGALCREYALVEKHGTNLFIVDAVYNVPTAADPGLGGDWIVSISGSLDTDFTDVERLTPQEKADGIEPKIVGPYAYKRVKGQIPEPNTADHIFFTVTGSDGKDVELFVPRKESKRRRIPVGMDYYPPVAAVTCVKRFDAASLLRNMTILNHLGAVNDRDINILGRVVFFRSQLMLAAAPGIDEIRTSDRDKPIAQVVTLVFSARMDSWQYRTVHTYSDENETSISAAIVRYKPDQPTDDDDGTVHPVEPVEEEFRRQPWLDLDAFLRGL